MANGASILPLGGPKFFDTKGVLPFTSPVILRQLNLSFGA